MKDLSATAGSTVAATPEQCVAFLAAVDGYPRWYPQVIPEVLVLERGADGIPTRARTRVHLAAGPLVREFQLVMAIAVQPLRQVTLTRVGHHAADDELFEVTWVISPSAATRIELKLAARLDVPRLVPVGAIGQSAAQGFVAAATRALEESSANAPAKSS
jgi:hypothetical protein